MNGYKIVLCTGGRKYRDRETINSALDTLKDELKHFICVHGDAAGADAIVKELCHRKHMPCYSYPAEWETYGHAAGPMRNSLMLDMHPDTHVVVAFHDNLGQSKGTLDMVEQAMARGIPVVLHANGQVTEMQQLELLE